MKQPNATNEPMNNVSMNSQMTRSLMTLAWRNDVGKFRGGIWEGAILRRQWPVHVEQPVFNTLLDDLRERPLARLSGARRKKVCGQFETPGIERVTTITHDVAVA
jgi:hypothetical protein